MPRVRIPEDIVTLVQQDLVIQGTVQSDRRVLKPDVINCVKAKLGVRYAFPMGWGFGMFVFGDAPDPLESAEGDRVYITLYTPPRTDRSNLSGTNPEHVESVLDALRDCADRPVIRKKNLENELKNREGRRAFRSALGIQGPGGKELPEDVARKIAKMVVEMPKPTTGGRKKTLGRKTKRTRRHTRGKK